MTVPPLCEVIISIVGKRGAVCYNVRRKEPERLPAVVRRISKYEKTKEIGEKFDCGIDCCHAGRHPAGLWQCREGRRYDDPCRLIEGTDLVGTLKPDGQGGQGRDREYI